ncbi:MAG: hypothetical protein BWY78_00926 [Alphaproteobacteria bacterium ADurb.Bin438]|nr:MAG: hypothetical protein BWY78_00926 [Alphaproteobacteria bacterium ADurb.Bin438]
MTNNGVKYAIIVTNQEKNYNLNLSDQVAEMTNRFDEPVILVGGFNITPWSYKSLPYFESSFKTNILDGNYPSHLINLLKKPMDYIYTHDGIDIINQEIGEDNGSRYLPVLSTISIRPI